MMRIFSFKEFSLACPEFGQVILSEYQKNKGFFPYERGYVYCIRAVGTNYYKLGKSQDAGRRIAKISPKMPFETEIIKVWRSDFMSLAEEMLHDDYAELRVNGEWFNFDSIEENLAQNPETGEYQGPLLSSARSLGIRQAYARYIDRLFNECDSDEWRNLRMLCAANRMSDTLLDAAIGTDFVMHLLQHWFNELDDEKTESFFNYTLGHMDIQESSRDSYACYADYLRWEMKSDYA